MPLMEKVLQILEEDCTTPPEEIAKRLNTSPDEIKKLIKQAEDQGLILGYTAVVNWARLHPQKVYAFIAVNAIPEHGIGFDKIAARIARFPEVHSMYLISGTSDLLVVVEADDLRQVAAFVAEKLAPTPGVSGTATSFVLKMYKKERRLIEGPEGPERLAIAP